MAPGTLELPAFDAPPDALRLEGLAVARGGVRLLAELDRTVPPGQALIVRGPNGAGKTTLLRTIAGLQPPAAGRVAPGPDVVAYAAHADGLKAALTVEENLRFWARIHGHRETAAACAAFDLGGLAHRPTAALSAGQKRRLGLARLVLTGRPVWLLDEPTVSLDAAATRRFAGIVAAHLARGGLALIATHIVLGLAGADTLDLARHRANLAATNPAATGPAATGPAAPGHAGPGPAPDAFADDDGSAYL